MSLSRLEDIKVLRKTLIIFMIIIIMLNYVCFQLNSSFPAVLPQKSLWDYNRFLSPSFMCSWDCHSHTSLCKEGAHALASPKDTELLPLSWTLCSDDPRPLPLSLSNTLHTTFSQCRVISSIEYLNTNLGCVGSQTSVYSCATIATSLDTMDPSQVFRRWSQKIK